MEITFQIPDEIARQIVPNGLDPARVALESLALEGYRARLLFESDLCRLLGFDSSFQVHAFLKQHGVYLQYDVAEFEKDEQTFRGMHQEILDNMASRHR